MFRNSVYPPLWMEQNDDMFNGIPVIRNDVYDCGSLTATLRALLISKEVPCEPAETKFSYNFKSRRFDGNITAEEAFEEIYGSYPWRVDTTQNKLFMLEIYTGSDKVNEIFDKISESFCGLMESNFEKKFTEVKKIRMFYKKTLNVLCFIDPENRNSIVIFEKKGIDCWHYVQLGLPTYMPWFFCLRDDEGNPVTNEDGSIKLNLTDVESRLLKTLRERDKAPYLAVLQEIAELYKLDEARIKAHLGDFEKQWAESHRRNVVTEIESLMRQIKNYEQEISNMLVRKREKDLMLIGIDSKINNTECRTLEYFVSNKGLKLVDAASGLLRFDATGYLEVFDEECAEEYIKNKSSIIYRRSDLSKDDTEDLFTEIFVNRSIKIKVVAQYIVDINRNRVDGISNARYTTGLIETHYPNPHIHHYSCLGDYSRMMCEALESEDVVTCLELCQMSSRSINFSDSTVMERFVEEITSNSSSRNDKKIFELPDGSSVNLGEAVKYVRENKKTEEE